MLRLLDARNKLPTSFIVDPNAEFQPGQIAALKWDTNNAVVVCVSDGLNPIGIIDDIKNAEDDSTIGSGRVTIWSSRMVISTDQFESQGFYANKTPLFISKNGKFTSIKPSNYSPQVGQVIQLESPTQLKLECEFPITNW